jgi:hypothetical protein
MADADPLHFNGLPVHNQVNVTICSSRFDFRGGWENGAHGPFSAAAGRDRISAGGHRYIPQ